MVADPMELKNRMAMDLKCDKYRFVMDLLRDEILDLTCEQIADKLSDQFIEKYGAIVMEKAYISDDELRKRVVEKLSERIIDEYCGKRKGTNND